MEHASYFLNGCAGSGKSELAKALQVIVPYQLLHLSLDGWLAFQGAAKWNRFPNKQEVWDHMLDGFHATIAATIDAGTAVVVDHVLQEKRWLPLLAPILATRNVYFVGVRCPEAIAQSRIDARGLNDSETIPYQLARIHRHDLYDLTVESHQEAPEGLARKLLELAARGHPTAFAELARRTGAEPTGTGDALQRA